MKRIAIVGGGWAGLACGMELAAAGRAASVFESARQVGGRARGFDWKGLRLDNGQHLLVGAYRETLRLMRLLRTDHLLERRPLELQLPGFRMRLPQLPEPLHLAIGLLRAQGLSLKDKYAAVRFIEALRTNHFRLSEDLAVERFLHEHRQSVQLVDRLWAPICIAALNTPLEHASAQTFCNVLRDSLMGPRADSDLLMNRVALGRLFAETAVDYIQALGGEVRTATKVQRIRREADGLRLDGPDEDFDHVVVATHPSRVPALLAELPGSSTLAGRLSKLRWQPILTLWLRFRHPVACPFPMFGLGGGHAPWAFERDDVTPGLVAIVVSSEGPHLSKPHTLLRDEYLHLLAQVVGPLPPLLDWICIVEKRATFACTPNLDRPGNDTGLPGLFLAGDYTAGPYPATLEGAVRSGVECARLILEQL